MYRIEVAPGEETVFRTIEELAVGIRNGVITPRSRIYHNASQKWLPIGLHPHYKKALELPAASAAHPTTPTPLPAVRRTAPRPEAHATEPAPKVPAPVMSPVIAMQQEVLRDLPVVAIPEPEPLPWAAPPTPRPRPAAHATAPAPASIARLAQAVQAQPTATVTYAPLVFAEPAVEPSQVAPEESAHARPIARRSARGGRRPFLLLGVAAALVVGTHFALTATPSTSAIAPDAAEPIDAGVDPDAGEPATDGPAEPAGAAAELPAQITTAPARVPMTPGPAFAGSVPARPGSDSSVASRAPSPTPRISAAAPAAPSIEPAPVEMELALPALPADSVVPSARTGDTLGMKKILRALNGTASPETPAAP